jgi:RNA polymerase sigma-54 factor
MKLTQTTTQQQRILPTQIQYLNFLKLQQQELVQAIREEMEDNVFLESDLQTDEEHAGDELDRELTYEDSDTYEEEFSYREAGINDSKLHAEKKSIFSNAGGLVYAREEILESVRLLKITDEQFKIAEYVMHCLDNDSYLRMSTDDIADSLSFSWQRVIEADEVETVIGFIQEASPAGCAARNLRECMLLQIFRKAKKTKADVNAYGIIEEDFELLCSRNFQEIATRHELNEQELQDAMKVIRKLNAYGCNLDEVVSNQTTRAETAIDFIIAEDETGELKGELAESYLGYVRISTATAETLKSLTERKKKSRTEAAQETYLKSKAQSAKWFVDCISQREQSMKLVIDCIVDIQRNYLKSGDNQDLVPMVLQDIADRTDLDVSTVSRITSTRFAETPHGKLALKDLFTFGIQSSDGVMISNSNVKDMLAAIISEEDKNNPYTDQQIAAILANKGITIARRTVLKYRDELGFPPAKLRMKAAA